MEPIYGRLFRAQEQDQPLWRRVLLGVLAAGMLAMNAWCVFYAGLQSATFFRSLSPDMQTAFGHLGGFLLGLQYLILSARYWTQHLFHRGAMRDLALTPGSPARILKIGLHLDLRSGRALMLLVLILFFAPWLWHESIALGLTPGWTWILPFAWPIALFLSAVLVLTGRVMVEACGLAACMLASTLGLGGLSPRYPLLRRALLTLQTAVTIGSLLALALAVASAMVPPLPAGEALPDWQRLGDAVLAVAKEPSHPLHNLIAWSPSTFWFDAYTHMLNGPYGQATWALFGCAAIILAAMACTALCLPYGFSAEARLGYAGASQDPRPAQAALAPARAFDADDEREPLERLLLRRFGRMARAALRLMTRNQEAGSLDRLFLRTIYLAPITIVVGWLAMHTLPAVAGFFFNLWHQPLLPDQYRTLSQGVGVLVLVFVYFTRTAIWGKITHVLPQGPRPVNLPEAGMSLFASGKVAGQQVRGDSRIPLNELYAIGFADALLLPTLYALLWSALLAALAFGEAVALNLPAEYAALTAASLAALVPQTVFTLGLISIFAYCKTYQRTWTALILQSCFFSLVFISMSVGVMALVAHLVQHVVDDRRPLWIAWVGSVNIVLVFDVAIYMFARMLYVRRRFDTENPVAR